MNKTAQLEALLLTHEPAITVLTETWLTDAIYDSEFVPVVYKVYRKDRCSKGGGVSIIFKTGLKIFRMPDVTGVECIFCKACVNNVTATG